MDDLVQAVVDTIIDVLKDDEQPHSVPAPSSPDTSRINFSNYQNFVFNENHISNHTSYQLFPAGALNNQLYEYNHPETHIFAHMSHFHDNEWVFHRKTNDQWTTITAMQLLSTDGMGIFTYPYHFAPCTYNNEQLHVFTLENGNTLTPVVDDDDIRFAFHTPSNTHVRISVVDDTTITIYTSNNPITQQYVHSTIPTYPKWLGNYYGDGDICTDATQTTHHRPISGDEVDPVMVNMDSTHDLMFVSVGHNSSCLQPYQNPLPAYLEDLRHDMFIPLRHYQTHTLYMSARPSIYNEHLFFYHTTQPTPHSDQFTTYMISVGNTDTIYHIDSHTLSPSSFVNVHIPLVAYRIDMRTTPTTPIFTTPHNMFVRTASLDTPCCVQAWSTDGTQSIAYTVEQLKSLEISPSIPPNGSHIHIHNPILVHVNSRPTDSRHTYIKYNDSYLPVFYNHTENWATINAPPPMTHPTHMIFFYPITWLTAANIVDLQIPSESVDDILVQSPTHISLSLRNPVAIFPHTTTILPIAYTSLTPVEWMPTPDEPVVVTLQFGNSPVPCQRHTYTSRNHPIRRCTYIHADRYDSLLLDMADPASYFFAGFTAFASLFILPHNMILPGTTDDTSIVYKTPHSKTTYHSNGRQVGVPTAPLASDDIVQYVAGPIDTANLNVFHRENPSYPLIGNPITVVNSCIAIVSILNNAILSCTRLDSLIISEHPVRSPQTWPSLSVAILSPSGHTVTILYNVDNTYVCTNRSTLCIVTSRQSLLTALLKSSPAYIDSYTRIYPTSHSIDRNRGIAILMSTTYKPQQQRPLLKTTSSVNYSTPSQQIEQNILRIIHELSSDNPYVESPPDLLRTLLTSPSRQTPPDSYLSPDTMHTPQPRSRIPTPQTYFWDNTI